MIAFSDITEIVAQRDALKRNNTLLRLVAVIQDSQDAIIVQDLEGRILAWSPMAVERYGWTEAEALTMNFREHIPANLRDEALQKIREITFSEVLETYKTKRLTKSGAVVDISVTSIALLTQDKKVYAISTIERARPSPDLQAEAQA